MEWVSRCGGPRSRFAPLEPLEGRRLLALPGEFESTLVADLNTTTSAAMAFSPDGRLFVGDTTNGQIHVIKDNALLPTPALTLSVDRYLERGINGIAFDPNYATNRYVYVYYTKPDPNKPNANNSNAVNRLVRYQTKLGSPDVIDPATVKVLLDNIPNPTGSHNGGAMSFGPDGMLYLAVGEDHMEEKAQDLSSLLGKVLRLKVSDANPTAASVIPADNPFVGQSGARGEIWAYGFRNPFSGAFKPGTDTLYVNDVGKSTWEEINSVVKGGNYGWPDAEGDSSNPAQVDPVYSYNHNGSQAAIVGGAFYVGSNFPVTYVGKYFFADYTLKFIKTYDPATDSVSTFGTNLTELVDLDVAPDGTLWTLTVNGEVRRIQFVGNTNLAPEAVANATSPASGLSPLTVSFTGDGGSDPEGATLSYSWDFGDGAIATGKDVSHTYEVNGTFTVRLTVSDGDRTDQSDPITVTVGNRAPTGVISAPVHDSFYSGGETISFSGTGSDPEDGTLPASAFHWTVVFHHDDHTHPFLSSITNTQQGTFTIPDGGEKDANQWYRVHLTVTDAGGLTHSSFTDVTPRTSTITLASSVPGLNLTLDGQPVSTTTPFQVVGVEGVVRTLGATPLQTFNGKAYEFVGWSDGGAATHDITTPVSDTTYTATFRELNATLLRPVDDAYVRGGFYAANNFGSSTQLLSKRAGSDTDRESYLKFDLSALASIGTAKLRLFGVLSNHDQTNVGFGLYPVANTSWSEGSLTYNNRPTAGSTALATFTVIDEVGRWYELDVTNYLKQQKAAGASFVAFAVKGLGSSSPFAVFNSDEAAANKPLMLVAADDTSPSGTTLHAAAAAYVRDGTYATQNFGAAADLYVKQAAGEGSTRESYLKFDLGTIASVTAAKLRLNGRISDTRSASLVTNVYSVDDTSWTENGLTWNSRPVAGATLRGAVTVTGTSAEWYEIDLTSFLQAELSAGRKVVTLLLRGAAVSGAQTLFASDETASAPQLVIGSEPVPPPTPAATYAAAAATYVRDGGSGDTNYGTADDLYVKQAAGVGSFRETYLKFDLSSRTSPVTSAKLRLNGRISDTRNASITVNVFSASNTSWSETALTWNTKPAAGAVVHAAVTVAGTSSAWYEVDLTAFLQAEFAAGRKVVTLVLRGSAVSESQVLFASDETANGPQLIVA